MNIFCFDPGSVCTGVAKLSPDLNWCAEQFEDPAVALWYVCERYKPGDVVLVEKYRSAGYLTKDGQETIEVIGYLKHTLEVRGIDIVWRVEQHRLSGVSQADEWMMAKGIANPSDNRSKDARAALAHTITYDRELRMKK